MKKVWADKSLNITPDDKFVKPSEWNNGCADLQGMGGGYGDEGGYQTIEELKNPTPREPSENNTRREESVNDAINRNEEIDFNQ